MKGENVRGKRENMIQVRYSVQFGTKSNVTVNKKCHFNCIEAIGPIEFCLDMVSSRLTTTIISEKQKVQIALEEEMSMVATIK